MDITGVSSAEETRDSFHSIPCTIKVTRHWIADDLSKMVDIWEEFLLNIRKVTLIIRWVLNWRLLRTHCFWSWKLFPLIFLLTPPRALVPASKSIVKNNEHRVFPQQIVKQIASSQHRIVKRTGHCTPLHLKGFWTAPSQWSLFQKYLQSKWTESAVCVLHRIMW